MSVRTLACVLVLAPTHNFRAVRAQKALGLTSGSPSYTPLEGIQVPDVPTRTYRYSDDGRLFAYTLPTWSVSRQQDTPI